MRKILCLLTVLCCLVTFGQIAQSQVLPNQAFGVQQCPSQSGIKNLSVDTAHGFYGFYKWLLMGFGGYAKFAPWKGFLTVLSPPEAHAKCPPSKLYGVHFGPYYINGHLLGPKIPGHKHGCAIHTVTPASQVQEVWIQVATGLPSDVTPDKSGANIRGKLRGTGGEAFFEEDTQSMIDQDCKPGQLFSGQRSSFELTCFSSPGFQNCNDDLALAWAPSIYDHSGISNIPGYPGLALIDNISKPGPYPKPDVVVNVPVDQSSCVPDADGNCSIWSTNGVYSTGISSNPPPPANMKSAIDAELAQGLYVLTDAEYFNLLYPNEQINQDDYETIMTP